MFFVGLTILTSFTNAIPLNATTLSCASMNHQECKARPEIVNVNSNNPIFYPFSIKTSKCSGNCNIVNDPYARICISDIVKNLNVKVFYLMSRTNETRHIKWHGTCICECRLDSIVCNNKQRWNKDKCRSECNKLIDKGVCDKGYAWSSSNCECECDKSCDFGEYWDYGNFKCRKKLVAALIEKCTETVEEVKLANIIFAENENENSYKCTPCIVYIALLLIFFTINVIGIVTYVYSQWYLKKYSRHVDFNTYKETTIY